MAKVKSFRITADGVPDREIRDFLDNCEREATVNVSTLFIPAIGRKDAQVLVIATRLDEPLEITNGPNQAQFRHP